jgi:general stress protein 26
MLEKQKSTNNIQDLSNKAAIDKLKTLAMDIDICLFCTNLKTDDGSTCRPMSTQDVCEQGNLWFFSDAFSDKNRDIKMDNHVQLFYAHPGKNSYIVVNGEAEIIIDKQKTEQLWTPMVGAWFTEGKDDPNISIIKVKPYTAYYWDLEGNKMINFFKVLASAASGNMLLNAKEGRLWV